ncbi:hypothetical protein LRS10_11465 [Phenylobacterium sp. J426]|uniref:hypothetical protein n=1 Tax=Phenylobacterium sp. J426 TaxID=2898439 RepID=UPI00215147B3|nr:hypothetical protein [Phenylobacterium sp. J426]MCR5874730.1 hypothetical protein [Phenylobacterium sp. J426]
MRKWLTAALAGATVAGGAAIAGQAMAQRYYYPPAPSYSPYYDGYYRAPAYPQPYGYYDNRGYDNRYYGGYGSSAGVLGSVLGSVLGLSYPQSFYSNVPVDRYGPDPNGMIGPDGRRIKCKLRRTSDGYYGTTVRRECWSR